MNSSTYTDNDINISSLNEVVFKYLDFRGKTPLKIGMEWGGGEILALSANNVVMGGINKDKEAYYGSELLYSKWMNKGVCELGDILLTMEAPLGKVAQIPDNKKYILSQRVILVKLRKSIVSPDYIFHLFMGDEFQRNLIKHSTGSTVTGIQQKKLDKITISYPSLKKQEKIAKILTITDQLIENTQALIDKHTAIKQGMMADLFTRGIDLTTGQLRPPVEQALHLYKETELGWIPKEWDANPLSDYFSYISYGFTNPMPEVDDGPYMITAANIFDGNIQYDTARHTDQQAYDTLLTKKSRPEIGDLLLTKDGSLGRMAIVDKNNICINQSVAVFRPNDLCNVNLIKYLLETEVYQQKMLDDAGGSTIKHIYITIIDKMHIGLPNKEEEQIRLMSIIKNMREDISILQNQKDKLELQKRGLMQDLLTGKVTVKHDKS